jgi:hypothetical protein
MLTDALDDLDPEQRKAGIAAGFAWRAVAAITVFYLDHGWSRGMLLGLEDCKAKGQPHELRRITAPVTELRTCDRCGALTPNVRRCRECKRIDTVPRRRPRALSEAQCLALLEQRRAGTRGRKLAELFGVSYDTVRRITMYYGVSAGGWHGRGAGDARDGSKPPDPPPGALESDRLTCRPYGSAMGTDADWPSGQKPYAVTAQVRREW